MNQWQSLTRYLETIEDEIRNRAPRDTGALGDSIAASFEQTSTGFTIGISMLDYGYYQDQGVNGINQNWGSPFSYRDKMPPASAFAKYGGNGYPIAKSIYENGIRPKRFIEPVLDDNIERLATYAAEDIWDYWYQMNK